VNTLQSPAPSSSAVRMPRFPRMGDAVTDLSFGARLKQLREQAGLTQPELAERAGMNRFGIAKLEQGVREPTWATVQALCQALGLSCAAFEGTTSSGGIPPEPSPETPPGGKSKSRRKPGPSAS
jgi:DNA-binding XRE family transcriptional regulator